MNIKNEYQGINKLLKKDNKTSQETILQLKN